MFRSMTGIGTSKKENDEFILSVEVRTLNSKFTDLSFRTPKVFNQFEMEFRNLVINKLLRGKISVDVDIAPKSSSLNEVYFNHELFKHYYGQLKKMADGVMATYDELFKLALQSPDVMVITTPDDQLIKAKDFIMKGLQEACEQCEKFRENEGGNMEKTLSEYASNIGRMLIEIEPLDEQRTSKIRERIKTNAEIFLDQIALDQNRFEQELMYYVEKLDISEEKVRLKSHLDYFLELLESKEVNGKKLGFLSQEIGREINTIGAKANNAEIQKIVVAMKDELEKIKEQTANVL